MSESLLLMEGICKSFGDVTVLKDAFIELNSGEVHALLGENGAGKSTLMKILSGVYSKDKGNIYVNSELKNINSIQDAFDVGVSVIYQELTLVPHMTVYENIFCGKEAVNKFGFLDKKKMIESSQILLDEFELNISSESLVGELNIAQQQMVEIVRAISYQTKIIVMDEPTSSLTDKEVNFLFQTIKNLKSKGVGIIYISHRMSELFEISDKITVMRDGKYIGTKLTKETNVSELISMMVGRELKDLYSRDFRTIPDDIVLEVNNLSCGKYFSDVSFNLKKGEILGFSGLVGSGRSEIMKTIFGIFKPDSGELKVFGEQANIKNVEDAIRLGVVLVPEDRKKEGLILKSSVGFNITLGVLDKFISSIIVNRKKEKEIINDDIKKFSIKLSDSEQKVSELSGGNQQKVVLAKWLETNPKIIILDEPTRGVDVGAKSEIYAVMNSLTEQGISIIMVSSDLQEVINMSDRVAVVYSGKINGIVEREDMSQENIMFYATGGKKNDSIKI